MNKGIHVNPLIIALILFVAVFAAAVFGVRQFGVAIQSRLQNLLPVQPAGVIVDKPSKRVRKITIADEFGGCIEVTPDGAVRVYKECGGELDNAYRPQDPKYILQLFQKIQGSDLSKFRIKPQDGEVITLIIETDQGTETIYLPAGGGGGSDDIIETIENIEEEIPPPTPTPTLVPSASPSPTLSGSPTPTQVGGGPTTTPTPTTMADPVENPFTCGYSDGESGKPFRISNIVCTTEPTPGQQ